jgi:hypothetical protein
MTYQRKPQEGNIILIDHADVTADGHGSYLKVYAVGGETYRIAEKRNNLWAIFQNARKYEPALLILETYKNIQYVADAKAITDDILKQGIQKLGEKVADQANEERSRSTALSYSKDLCCADKIGLTDLYQVAENNYQFIKRGIVELDNPEGAMVNKVKLEE